MKRADEARVIKIAEAPPAGAAPQVGGVLPQPNVTNPAQIAPPTLAMVTNSATTIFPTRPIISAEMPQQPLPVAQSMAQPSGVIQQPANFTRVIAHGGTTGAGPTSGGVSVYRGDGGGVAITAVSSAPAQPQMPPVAHAGQPMVNLPPPNLHPTQVGNPVVTQPPSNIKPEPISKLIIYNLINLI